MDGSGQSIVILDTGIDLDHPFFGPDLDGDGVSDRIVYHYDFAATPLTNYNDPTSNDDNDASDSNGHGSHVASIAASSDSNYPGIAPGADIIVLKVFDNNNSGNFFDIEQALQWVVANQQQYNIASVNMSLSTGGHYVNPTNFGIIHDELQQLAQEDVIVVSAAGNTGQYGVSYPAANPYSLAVSSVDDYNIRITDIQGDRFSVKLQETNLRNQETNEGNHLKETSGFLVLEKGIWELSDGTIIEVGTTTTDATTKSGWESITFNHDFDDAPIILTQVQTDNDATFVQTRQKNITENGFELALEEEEAYLNTGHGAETIAWLAISPGQGDWDGNAFMAGNTGDQVTHNWHTVDFGNLFNNAPKFFGNIASYDGPDSAGLRAKNLSSGSVEIKIDEDTSKDSEVDHTTEEIGLLAIEATGTLEGSENTDALTGLVVNQAGTVNNDTFIVGDAQKSFYDSYGQQDYLEISGFSSSQDLIQLYGAVGDYSVGVSPYDSNDQGIFLEVAGMKDELVAIVKNSNNLDLNSNDFVFV